jgi:hypothetical protein
MHAVVISVSFTDRSAAQESLGELVPRVSASPGFVAGYWFGVSDTRGGSVAVFDTEAQAEALAEKAKMAPGGGPVKIESIEVAEVVASA